MASQDLGEQLRELSDRPYEHPEVASLLATYHAPEVAADLQAEYAVMPKLLSYLLVESWRLADEAGKSWEFTSLSPDRPIEFARHDRVRFVVDVDEHGVSFGIAHVHGHKADWYQPGRQPISARAEPADGTVARTTPRPTRG